MNALHLLGTGLSAFTSSDRGAAHEIVALVGRYTLSTDPRVRGSAFEALLEMNRRGQKLDLSMYGDFCSALNDDYDGVRKAAIKLIYVLATTYPDEQVKPVFNAASQISFSVLYQKRFVGIVTGIKFN